LNNSCLGYFDKALADLKKAVQLSPENKEFKAGLEQCRNELIKETQIVNIQRHYVQFQVNGM
jgi:hypothetical protein